MKTAILVLLSEDGKAGKAITDVLPFDEAKGQYKALCEGNVSPDPAYPVLALVAGFEKRKRLKGTTGVSSTAPLEVTAESTGSGEGDLSGEGGAGDSGETGELDLLGDETSETASADEASPGSLSPKGKKGK